MEQVKEVFISEALGKGMFGGLDGRRTHLFKIQIGKNWMRVYDLRAGEVRECQAVVLDCEVETPEPYR